MTAHLYSPYRYPPTMGDKSPKGRNNFDPNSSFNRSGRFNSGVSGKSGYGGEGIHKRRIVDGTSEKELMKAMSTFLNRTGAGDYNLPNLTGERISVAGKGNQPSWSLKDRTKLSWFPQRYVDF